MDRADSILTRLAIEEITREMHENREREQLRPVERKVNPLVGKPNKRFLGRTLNSMLTYNKREDNRTKKKCRKKLKELNKRRQQRFHRNGRGNDRDKQRKRSRSESSHAIYSSSSSGSSDRSRQKRKHKRVKKKQSKSEIKDDRDVKEEYGPEYTESIKFLIERSHLAMAAASYNQMNLLHYQAQLSSANVNSHALTSNERSPSLSTSSSSSEDVNGVLTINLSSDENCQRQSRKYKKHSSINFDSDSNTSNERKSTISCISLNSSATGSKINKLSKANSTSGSSVILTCSSSSDCDSDVAVISDIPNVVPIALEKIKAVDMVDLTDD